MRNDPEPYTLTPKDKDQDQLVVADKSAAPKYTPYATPGYVEVLTWGTMHTDSKYRTPVNHIIKHQNPGHGALLINLPDTPEYLRIYQRLTWMGYPCQTASIYQPLKHTDTKGQTSFRRGPLQTRLIVRYSAYALEFADETTDQILQRRGRPVVWQAELFQHLSHYEEHLDGLIEAQNIDLESSDRDKKNKQKQIHLFKFKFYQHQFQNLSNSQTMHLFDAHQAVLLATLAIKTEPHSALNWGDVSANRGIYQVFHPSLYHNCAADDGALLNQFKQNSDFLTIGCPPDSSIMLPLKNEQHPFGLSLDALVDQMVKIQIKKHLKFFIYANNYLSDNPTIQKQYSQKLEKKASLYRRTQDFKFTWHRERLLFLQQFLQAAITLNLDPPFKQIDKYPTRKEFKQLLLLFDTLIQKSAKDKMPSYVQPLLQQFASFLRENELIAWLDDIGMQNRREFFNNNCCAQVKKLLRKAVCPQYQKYLTTSKVSLDTPVDLQTKVAKLSHKIGSQSNPV